MEDTKTKSCDVTTFASMTYNITSDGYCQEGLTIREYFAAKAMQSLCINNGKNCYKFNKVDELAIEAVNVADALIRALKNKG